MERAVVIKPILIKLKKRNKNEITKTPKNESGWSNSDWTIWPKKIVKDIVKKFI